MSNQAESLEKLQKQAEAEAAKRLAEVKALSANLRNLEQMLRRLQAHRQMYCTQAQALSKVGSERRVLNGYIRRIDETIARKQALIACNRETLRKARTEWKKMNACAQSYVILSAWPQWDEVATLEEAEDHRVVEAITHQVVRQHQSAVRPRHHAGV